ncbi:hypothetical protein LV564_11765 [Komagataeibacter nataicola]|uniref:hypothetical protein n=1 Tax=Komagataeibacter nataicola TaxID=265960 RepID=UPI0011B42F63|nr:hypothetical protein [Komagataeibacter nataicola]WEQ54833.1 hypothetical protein LV564_11765 [Komagataeibacter nataicola]
MNRQVQSCREIIKVCGEALFKKLQKMSSLKKGGTQKLFLFLSMVCFQTFYKPGIGSPNAALHAGQAMTLSGAVMVNPRKIHDPLPAPYGASGIISAPRLHPR